ncbi:hypothetical protein L3081_13630 [Colwellia sp. MSW7]|uniref:Uncharacterized protein n=1 Tax=Colwellia maritima TaxID=2912588 RepID=A0ABS9X1V0_9GAMM|nr:hypothetical protein [Colwellia maritima]MCI2284233.1 hypothetical protein [Colwellia maritima]
MMNNFSVPNSIDAITALVGEIQIDCESHLSTEKDPDVYVFYNRMQSGAIYQPISQRLLPLDQTMAT